jgi:predicted nucleic acid-binding protein
MGDALTIVVDASIAVKWYLLDEDSPEDALALRSDFIAERFAIAMPDVARYEVANAINVARRRGRISHDGARQALSDFLAWDFAYLGGNDLILAAVAAAERVGCSLYDALYLALAESLGCDFVTADRALFERVHPAAAWIKWLGDYTTG